MDTIAAIGAVALNIIFVCAFLYHWRIPGGSRPTLGLVIFTGFALTAIYAVNGSSLLSVVFGLLAGAHFLILIFRK